MSATDPPGRSKDDPEGSEEDAPRPGRLCGPWEIAILSLSFSPPPLFHKQKTLSLIESNSSFSAQEEERDETYSLFIYFFKVGRLF